MKNYLISLAPMLETWKRELCVTFKNAKHSEFFLLLIESVYIYWWKYDKKTK